MGYKDGYTYWIAYSFECMPPDVRFIMKQFADAFNPVSGFVIAGYIDTLWSLANVPDPEWWKATYHHNLRIDEMTILIGDNEVRVYVCNRQWMNLLKLELLAGVVSVDMPSPCARLVGYGIPVPLAIP